MEEIIKKVIEIDIAAKRFIKTTEDKKANLDEYIEKESIKIEEEIKNLMENNLEKEKIRLEKHLETEKKNIAKTAEDELGRLDEFLNTNKDRLVNEVYENIIIVN